MLRPNQTMTNLNNKDGGSNFLLAIHRALKVTATLSRILYQTERSNKHFSNKQCIFSAQSLRYLTYFKFIKSHIA